MAEPEIAKDIELGFKGDWLDHRLRTNLAVYRTNYTNKQVSIQTCSATGLPPVGGTCPVGTGFSTIARNAAAARLKGIEGEFTFRPIEHLTLNASASALDAIFTKWDGAVSGEGAPVPNIRGVWVAGGTYGAPFQTKLKPCTITWRPNWSTSARPSRCRRGTAVSPACAGDTRFP